MFSGFVKEETLSFSIMIFEHTTHTVKRWGGRIRTSEGVAGDPPTFQPSQSANSRNKRKRKSKRKSVVVSSGLKSAKSGFQRRGIGRRSLAIPFVERKWTKNVCDAFLPFLLAALWGEATFEDKTFAAYFPSSKNTKKLKAFFFISDFFDSRTQSLKSI